MSFTDEYPGYEDEPPTPEELEAWDASDRQDDLFESGAYDDVIGESRAAGWPAAATAEPPRYPFNTDRHDYADNAEWRKQNGLGR